MRGVRRTRYSAEELVRRLDETWVKLGFRPGGRLLKQKANISFAPYRERWGSLRAACEALARHKKGEISREELLRGNERRREGRESLPAKMRYAVMERGWVPVRGVRRERGGDSGRGAGGGPRAAVVEGGTA